MELLKPHMQNTFYEIRADDQDENKSVKSKSLH